MNDLIPLNNENATISDHILRTDGKGDEATATHSSWPEGNHSLCEAQPSKSYWIDHDKLSEQQKQVFCPNLDRLVDRVKFVHSLYKTGDLAEEAAALGITPSFIDRMHAESPKVVIDEQQQFLMNLFAAIDSYGTPAAMLSAFETISLLRRDLEIGLDMPVEAGFIVSRFHGVTFRGISFGGYLSLPQQQGDEFTKINLFSGKERDQYEHAAYADLVFSQSKVDEISKYLQKLQVQWGAQLKKAERGARAHSGFLEERRVSGDPIDAAKDTRLGEFEKRAEYYRDRLKGCEWLAADWAAAREGCAELVATRSGIPYIEFVAAFNRSLAQRIMPPGLEFKTFFNDAIEDFFSEGVKDWPLFVAKLISAGIISDREAIGRYRTEAGGKVRYYNAWLEQAGADRVKVAIRSEGAILRVCDIAELAQESLESLRAGKGPTLSPVSKVRYLMNLAFSPSVFLCDGVEFDPITKVTLAMAQPSFLRYPRGPKIHPYSGLWEFKPSDLSSPWAELKETRHAIDYYGYLASRCS